MSDHEMSRPFARKKRARVASRFGLGGVTEELKSRILLLGAGTARV
jgi:hypothetical protein